MILGLAVTLLAAVLFFIAWEWRKVDRMKASSIAFVVSFFAMCLLGERVGFLVLFSAGVAWCLLNWPYLKEVELRYAEENRKRLRRMHDDY